MLFILILLVMILSFFGMWMERFILMLFMYGKLGMYCFNYLNFEMVWVDYGC